MERYVIANWKMNKTVKESVSFVNELTNKATNKKTIVCICAPFTSLYQLSTTLEKTTIALGAQNVFYENKGAFTGEISPSMISELKCSYCLVGHSERRHIFNESDDAINKKLKALVEHKITPILCIGETLEQKRKGLTSKIIEYQLRSAVNGITELKDIIIAYEPVWAIGTGQNATPYQAEDAHKFIRSLIKKIHDDQTSENIPILYGGSVSLENIKPLMKMKNINGVLVGGASLDADNFSKIIDSIR